jgi:Formyl transferase
MRVVFLTTDDPIYLPAFFDRVLGRRTGEGDRVYVVPPLYRGQNRRTAAWRYYRTFGLGATITLARKILQAKLSRRSVSAVCELHRIPCEDIVDVNAEEFLGKLAALRPDLVVSVSCPQIFKRDLIELPAKGCLNIHGALLPDYRGVRGRDNRYRRVVRPEDLRDRGRGHARRVSPTLEASRRRSARRNPRARRERRRRAAPDRPGRRLVLLVAGPAGGGALRSCGTTPLVS